MNNRRKHDQLRNEAAHALSRIPNTVVLEVEPFRGQDAKGIFRNAGVRLPGGKAADVPDLLVVSNGKAYFLDAKTGSATLTEGQARFCEMIRTRAHATAGAFRSVEEAVGMVTNNVD
jgi:hypothetical protein